MEGGQAGSQQGLMLARPIISRGMIAEEPCRELPRHAGEGGLQGARERGMCEWDGEEG